VSLLEPGGKRRPLPFLSRALWGIAVGFALALVIALAVR
jgi:hypothetical protein